jgi:hypothetical protein
MALYQPSLSCSEGYITVKYPSTETKNAIANLTPIDLSQGLSPTSAYPNSPYPVSPDTLESLEMKCTHGICKLMSSSMEEDAVSTLAVKEVETATEVKEAVEKEAEIEVPEEEVEKVVEKKVESVETFVEKVESNLKKESDPTQNELTVPIQTVIPKKSIQQFFYQNQHVSDSQYVTMNF